MRIVHISDIHLSKENFAEFEHNYRKDLIKLLDQENAVKGIDIIAITGDLVDQGGHSLFEIPQFKSNTDRDPYKIFEDEFLTPIKKKLGFDNNKFLFIPGNHDIDETHIMWLDEKDLKKLEAKGEINDLLLLTGESADRYRARIKQFKDFEKRFHSYPEYKYSVNHSTYIYEYERQVKVGFAMINDSWRCSTCRLSDYADKKLYFGTNQLYDALKEIEGTHMNILLTHHPIESYEEYSEVERVLLNQPYHLHLFGDQHHQKIKKHISSTGECIGLMARAALHRPDEPIDEWKSGFHIIDIDFGLGVIERIQYYIYSYKDGMFSLDGPAAPRTGIDSNPKKLGIKEVKLIKKSDLSSLDETKYYIP